jgi:hypothetical protein
MSTSSHEIPQFPIRHIFQKQTSNTSGIVANMM